MEGRRVEWKKESSERKLWRGLVSAGRGSGKEEEGVRRSMQVIEQPSDAFKVPLR